MNILVIGAGLSGMTAAVTLSEAGHDVSVLEARSTAGGRIRAVRDEAGSYIGDLGPTWVWPAHQPVVRRWMADLGVEGQAQFNDGAVLVEQGGGAPVATMHLPGQDGSVRPAGGPTALIEALLARLPADRVLLNNQVTDISAAANGLKVRAGDTWHAADHVIVALPPRIAAHAIRWDVPIPPDLMLALSETPTWMAPHAKVVIQYETPFWRAHGLSGRIISREGPLVEAHDHAGANGSPAALFGFVGWPAGQRGDGLAEAVRAQLARCFGADAPAPTKIWVEDWALDPLVTVAEDLSGPAGHPAVRPDILRQTHCDGRLVFAGAETARISPGLIEGAFAAGEHAARLIMKSLS